MCVCVGGGGGGRGIAISFFFFHNNIIHYGYSLEMPFQGASNEYHSICLYGEIRKISIHFIKKSILSEVMTSFLL